MWICDKTADYSILCVDVHARVRVCVYLSTNGLSFSLNVQILTSLDRDGYCRKHKLRHKLEQAINLMSGTSWWNRGRKEGVWGDESERMKRWRPWLEESLEIDRHWNVHNMWLTITVDNQLKHQQHTWTRTCTDKHIPPSLFLFCF